VPKKKLIRFEQISSFPNVVQPDEHYPISDHPLKGKWSEMHFGNSHNLILEIGCGKGEYTLAMAGKNPHINHIGIDIKGDRIWRGAHDAINQNLHNAAFLRIQAQLLNYYFAPGEVSEIWLTFPDPQQQKSRERIRLTSPYFLVIYRNVLKPQGVVHLKTDHDMLFAYTLDLVKKNGHTVNFQTKNLYNEQQTPNGLLTECKTHYENIYINKGVPIKYLQFMFG